MFALPIPRQWLGAASALLVGLTAGCGYCLQCHKHAPACDSHAPCAKCTTAALPPGTAYALVPPSSLPLNRLPPVSNERYIAPDRPAGVVTAAKPHLDDSLLKPITPADRVDTTPMQRRSFPDITARAEFRHAPDYSWLVGELHYVPQKSQWRLRFASIDEEDKYGGSVTLDGGTHMMKEYHTGMLVRVEGTLADAEARDPSPMYKVRGVEPVKK